MGDWLRVAVWEELGLELVRPVDPGAAQKLELIEVYDVENAHCGYTVWLFLRWLHPRPSSEAIIREQTYEIWEKHGFLPVGLLFDLQGRNMQIYAFGDERLPFPIKIGTGVRDAIVWTLFVLFALDPKDVNAGLYIIEPRIPDIHPFSEGLDRAIRARCSGKDQGKSLLIRTMQEHANQIGHLRDTRNLSSRERQVLKFSLNIDASPFYVYAIRDLPIPSRAPWRFEIWRPARVEQKHNEPMSPAIEEEQQAVKLSESEVGFVDALVQAELVLPEALFDDWVEAHSLAPDKVLDVLDTFEALGVEIWRWPVLLPQKDFEAFLAGTS